MTAGILRNIEDVRETATPDWRQRIGGFVHAYRAFLGFVVLPTLLVAAYLYLFASDQYETRADFIVRRADAAQTNSNMGQLLGVNFGVAATSSEAFLVSDYLLSHQSIARLRREDQLVERFRRPGIDWWSRLWFADPKPEQLERYFRGQVDIEQDAETGISHLTVHAFTPQDAYEIGRKMLAMGEQRINQLNERTYRDQVSHSQRELREAEKELARAETRMTGFRRESRDIDPAGSGSAQIGLVSNLTAELTVARARLQAMEGVISRDSPQYRALAGQVRALEAQVAAQSSRLASGDGSIATSLGAYEKLVVQREAATRRFASAAAAFETARAEADRKQVYLVRVVDANLPVKALYPKRGKIVLLLFLSLALGYGILRMIVAGIREHHL